MNFLHHKIKTILISGAVIIALGIGAVALKDRIESSAETSVSEDVLVVSEKSAETVTDGSRNVDSISEENKSEKTDIDTDINEKNATENTGLTLGSDDTLNKNEESGKTVDEAEKITEAGQKPELEGTGTTDDEQKPDGEGQGTADNNGNLTGEEQETAGDNSNPTGEDQETADNNGNLTAEGQKPENDNRNLTGEGKNTAGEGQNEDNEYLDDTLSENTDNGNSPDTLCSIPLGDDDERYLFITGDVKKKYYIDHMPAGYRYDAEAHEKMTTITVPVWKLNDDWTRRESEMKLTINSLLADEVQAIFEEIYALDIQFPVKYMVGYNYRKVGGVGLVDSTLMSAHAFGVAIDINPDDYDNDYYLGKGNDLRNRNNPYCIPDEVIDIFKSHGWYWGGDFNICADTMHFQYFGLDFLEYEVENPEEPFPILMYGGEEMNSVIISNMQQRLVKLGYLAKVTRKFDKATDEAVRAFQEAEGMDVDGIVDYETWERLINLTHMMEYVF